MDTKRLIDEAVLKVLEPEALEWWWQTADPAFGGYSPQELFDAGQGSTVLHKAESYSDPSFS